MSPWLRSLRLRRCRRWRVQINLRDFGTDSSRAQRRIYDLLYKPGSHEVLYHTLQSFVQRIDGPAAVNAFCSLARLDTARWVQLAEPGQRPARGSGKVDSTLAVEAEEGLSQRLGLLLKNREDLKPVHVSNLMWSLAKVAAREPFDALCQPISKRLLAEVPRLGGRDLATSLWAVAVLVADTPHRQAIDVALPRFLLQRVGLMAKSKDLKGYDLTQSLWAAAKLANQGVPGMVKLISEIVHGALGEASTFEGHSISVSLWSIGLTEELHGMPEVQQFARELAAAAPAMISSMNSQMLANSAWGAARVQVNDATFYEALAKKGLELRATRDAVVLDQHIYNLAWSFVKAEVCTVGAAREYVLKAAEDGRPGGRLEKMAPYHVAGLAWVLSKGFTPDTLYENKDEVFLAPQAVQRAVRTAMRCANGAPEKFEPKELSWCVWGGARCKMHDAVLEMLPKTMMRYVDTEDLENVSQNFSMVLWSMGAAEIGRQQLPQPLLGRFLDAAKLCMAKDVVGEACRVTNLANAVWACAKADFAAKELIDFAIIYLSEAKEVFALRYYIVVAVARVVSVHPVSGRCARFVQRVYEESIQSLQSATDPFPEMQTNAEHMALLRLCLIYLPSADNSARENSSREWSHTVQRQRCVSLLGPKGRQALRLCQGLTTNDNR